MKFGKQELINLQRNEKNLFSFLRELDGKDVAEINMKILAIKKKQEASSIIF